MGYEEKKVCGNASFLVIDMMSVNGHISLNQFYLQMLPVRTPLYVAQDLHNAYVKHNLLPLGIKPCNGRLIKRLALASRVAFILLRNKKSLVLFLSYDLATFPLISRLANLRGSRVVCFEHNTAPQTKIKALWHQFSAESVQRLVFAPHIKKLYDELGLNAHYIRHPIIRPSRSLVDSNEWWNIKSQIPRQIQNVALCPSSSVILEEVEIVAQKMAHTMFILKGNGKSNLTNILFHPFFHDYATAMKESDFIFVPFPHEHKVSGPVFEAIATGKPVLVLPNVFGRYIKRLFGDQVFFPGQDVPKQIAPIAVDDYNDKILSSLIKVFGL